MRRWLESLEPRQGRHLLSLGREPQARARCHSLGLTAQAENISPQGAKDGRAQGRRLAVLTFLLALASPLAAAPADPVLWPEEQRAFYQDGPGLLLTDGQRAAFLAADEAGRAAFLRDFLGRDPDPATPDNELQLGIERRQRLAARDFPSPLDVRAQLLFLSGRPAARKILDCGAFRPLEIWTYGQPPDERPLVLYRPGEGEPFQLWMPIDSKRALYVPELVKLLEDWEQAAGLGQVTGPRIDLQICSDARDVDRATGIAGLGGEVLARITLQGVTTGQSGKPQVREFRWVRPQDRAQFLTPPTDLASWARDAAATELPDEPARLGVGKLDLDFPRRQGQRVAVRALVPVEAGKGLEATRESGKPEVRLTVSAVVEHEGKVFEELRVRYRLPPPDPDEPLALLLERSLRPERRFVLRLKVRDDVSGAEARVTRGFEVPAQPLARLGDAARTAARGELLIPGQAPGRAGLILPPPPEEVVLGVWRAEPLVSGERIVKVVFLVDGQAQLSRTRPPYAAEVRLAPFPKEQVVRVEGYDENGERVAADEVVLNRAKSAFKVALLEPRTGVRAAGRVRVRAEVAAPEERRIEAVEFLLNDATVATLTAPPWETQVEVPADEEIVYVSVVARLDDGSRAEEVRFLRAPENLEQMEVHLVELYAAVTDGSGEPVRGLGQGDFEVLEAGKPQALTKFERVQDLPLHLGLVIDTSTSMASSLGEAQRAAAGFLQNLVTPRDRCFAVGFAGRPYPLLGPTDDAEAVAQALEGTKALGATALHDAVVTALYYFRGARGQRALVLLSDGDDTASHTPFEQALEFAQRSGVTVYTIGLGVSMLALEARSKLVQLAAATGGEAFFIGRAEELSAVYDRIEEELRSRYLLAYQSERGEEDGFRPVEVKVRKRGLKVRTARGYYP